MKILTILTGGTIGSRVENGVIDVEGRSPYLLIDKYYEWLNKCGQSSITTENNDNLTGMNGNSMAKVEGTMPEIEGEVPEIEVIAPLNILSENIRPSDWKILAEVINEYLGEGKDASGDEKKDGIIITHGSDTLVYTANFLEMCFGDAKIPIVLTASNYALEDPRSIGLDNFIDCVTFISEAKKSEVSGSSGGPEVSGVSGGSEVSGVSGISRESSTSGVYVIYRNRMGVTEVFRPYRMRSADHFLDQFSDICGQPYGIISEGIFRKVKVADDRCMSDCALSENPLVGNLCNEELVVHPLYVQREPADEYQCDAIEYFQYDQIDYTFPNQVDILVQHPFFNYENYVASNKTKAVLVDAYHSATVCTGDDEYAIQKLIDKAQADIFIMSFKDVNSAQYASSDSLLKQRIVKALENCTVEHAYVYLLLKYNYRLEIM